MKIVRVSVFSKLAMALIASGVVCQSAVAQNTQQPAANPAPQAEHADHAHHDHAAMMAEQEKKIADTLATLPTKDQKLATAQRFCPMMPKSRLGAMGAPLKVMVKGKPVFVCCNDCKQDAVDGGAKTVAMAEKLTKVNATLATLPMEERMAIESQKYCAISEGSLLGGMGAPVKLEISGKPVYLCCKGCVAKAKADPTATMAKVEELKKAGMGEGHDHSDHEGHDHSDHEGHE